MNLRRFFTLILLAALAVSLIACSSGGNANITSESTPVDVAREFFNIIFTGETEDAMTLMCSAFADSDEMVQAFSLIRTALTAAGGEIDTSGMTFELTSEEGDNAAVNISGTVGSSQQGVSSMPFPEIQVPLVRENNVWKMCA